MGDMKTPDFDDLLAAFDIPDATSFDGKEAIQTSHDETEGHLKPAGMCMDDGIPGHHSMPALDIPAVSVIVKNTSRQESFEAGAEKEAVRQAHLVPNGFRCGAAAALDYHHLGHSSYGRLEASLLNGDSSSAPLENVTPHRPDRMPSFSQFSPISSPEPEEAQGNGIEVRPKQDERPYFPAASSFFEPLEPSQLDNQRKLLTYSMFDNFHKRDIVNEPANSLERQEVSTRPEQTRTEERSEGLNRDHTKRQGFLSSEALFSMDDLHGMHVEETSSFPFSQTGIGMSHQSVRTPASKLSSCLAALVALNAKKDAEFSKEKQAKPVQPSVSVKEAPKADSVVPKSPKSPSSPLEVVKRFKQPDSPMSACSDSSGKASPSVTTGSPPAIPRVRIKTIKMSSGQIKRTVTSVLPDSELEDLLSPADSTASQYTVSAEEMSPSLLPRPPSRNLIGDLVFENGKSKPLSQTMPAVKMMPTSASLQSKVTHVRAEGGFKKNAREQSSQNASSALIRAVNVVQQQHRLQKAVSVQLANAPNANFLPKAVHLANLNLVPHSVAASVTARSTTQRQNQPQLSNPSVCSTVPLVHQVKNTTPLPCTTLPNQAVDTLNRLLNATNPVPTYVPNLNPPPGCDIGLPARGYRCLECGDSFGLERSLAQHYGRRSVHIEVACMHCSKTLVFLNKCSLLAHAREHKSQGMVMQCTQLFMKPIPPDQMFASPLTGSIAATAAASQVFPSASGSPAPASLAKVKPAMPLYPDKIIRHGLKCLECNKQLADYRLLAGHYQRISEETEGLTCKLCPMLLPNKCSYKAHQRLHAHKSPYCCPECGAVSRSVDIQKHVKENCLHFARKIGHKCLHCELFYLSTNVQKRHIEEKHCEVFFKCSRCPVAFKSADGCLMHIKNKHTPSDLAPQLIYKCACETVFKKKQLLFQHFHQNAKKHCVFKCPGCTVVFAQKQPLMQHFKAKHGGVFRAAAGSQSVKRTEEVPPPRQEAASAPPRQANTSGSKPTTAAVQNDSPAAVKSNSKLNLKNTGWTCGDCLHWLPDRETYVSHMKTNHGKSVKRYPCQQCERSFNSSTSLRRHLRNDHMGKKKVYTCWYCTDEKTTFTKHFMLKNHISLMHGIKNPDFSQMTNPAPQGPSQGPGEGSGAKRRGEDAVREGAGGAALQAAPAKRPKPPKFRCAKCGFTTEDSVSLQQHIPQHKADDTTPQCAHCGLCFASQLALNRHLFIVHKVKQLEEEVEEEEEEEEEAANEQEQDEEGEGARSPPAGEKMDSAPPSGQTVPSTAEWGMSGSDAGSQPNPGTRTRPEESLS
ncbi:hypothetical protein SKAU_G00313830 [Synaphobranchus kaupii]|uniref:C2H2-type domain-containing protein n=1 Tax=Synaphobranchus kaupii TaxID=118154 RepID=A0A9Q1ESE0_SYNKA|nr:hypothetical protein SKAU_G00313830 [Synaphobranchus kaupii]